MPMHRKKPFSAKQKKEQLRAKREKKRLKEDYDSDEEKEKHVDGDEEGEEEEAGGSGVDVLHVHQQPGHKQDKAYDPNRYRLHFLQESKEDIIKRKEKARIPYETLPETALEVDVEDVYKPGSVLDMPKRPPWNYKESKAQLEAKEGKYFQKYLENIFEQHTANDLSYLELNLETWRQLWRVLEMSDIVLLITDIRHPALHFSPALYDYVTKDLRKPMVLVLNKIDLAPPSIVVAWKSYFTSKFPDLHIVCFTSYPKSKSELESMHGDPGKALHKRRKRGFVTAVGPKQLYKVCESIVEGKVELLDWKEKIERGVDGLEQAGGPEIHPEEGDGSYSQHVQYREGVLTFGCCGYPNVGKSSLINGLVGRKVVSISRTPGHTKHFQTIFLTKTVKLCDSPGLVFPSLVSKPMQILSGIYPIAQVREPYTAVGYLSQRLDLPRLLRLKHPDDDGEADTDSLKWSAYDICDAWAIKRGFLTAKAARPDVYRAANSILRSALDGRICLCMRPPRFTEHKNDWMADPETEEIAAVQEMHRKATEFSDSDHVSSESDDGGEKDRDEKDSDCEHNIVSASNPFSLLSED